MKIYLRILSVFYFCGALMHIADLLNLGQSHGLKFSEPFLAWKITPLHFALLDTAATIGPWNGLASGLHGRFTLKPLMIAPRKPSERVQRFPKMSPGGFRGLNLSSGYTESVV